MAGVTAFVSQFINGKRSQGRRRDRLRDARTRKHRAARRVCRPLRNDDYGASLSEPDRPRGTALCVPRDCDRARWPDRATVTLQPATALIRPTESCQVSVHGW
jgi:hypothetical protein